MKTLGGSFKEWKRNVKIDTIVEKSGGVYMRKRVNITVDAELWGQLQSLCARENWSCSGVIDACLRIVLGKERGALIQGVGKLRKGFEEKN